MSRLSYNRRALHRTRRGAMLILVAVMLVILLVMAVFSVDVAYMQLVRTQLRTATDAAARAASESLARTQSQGQARRAAIQAAAQNAVAGAPLPLENSDIEFGTAVGNPNGTFDFELGGSPRNAARVTGRRTGNSPGGPVNLFLGGILGTETFEPVAQSTSMSVVRDIALVLDRSGSMRGQKIADLQNAVQIFISVLQSTASDERVSLSTYSTTATKDVNMTSNLAVVSARVNLLTAAGFTAIGQGLQLGTNSLEFDTNSRAFAEKTIILMTDGIENRPPFVQTVVPTAQFRNHTVHTITFGSGADQNLMSRVASDTGGLHFHADNGVQLRQVFLDLARTLAVTTIE